MIMALHMIPSAPIPTDNEFPTSMTSQSGFDELAEEFAFDAF